MIIDFQDINIPDTSRNRDQILTTKADTPSGSLSRLSKERSQRAVLCPDDDEEEVVVVEDDEPEMIEESIL